MIVVPMAPGDTDLVETVEANSVTDVPSKDGVSLDDEMDLKTIFDEDRQVTLAEMSLSKETDVGDINDASILQELWGSSSPPPEDSKCAWQNEENDMPHRRELIRQVAKLLKDRKADPSPKFLKELPYKARKLEEQLYKSAASLEAYVDKTTLKQRLKRVAKAITSQFRSSRRSSSKTSRSSVSSRSSIGSMMSLDSFSSASLPASARSSISSIPRIISDTSSSAALSSNPNSLADIQQKQALNQKMQQEILENIRQQQKIMRDLLEKQKPEAQKKDDSATESSATGAATQSSSISKSTSAPQSLQAPKKSPKSFNHKELMAAAQNNLQNAMLNRGTSLGQRRVSSASPHDLLAAQQAALLSASNNSFSALQRSHSAPPITPAMMAAMQNNLGGGMTNDAASLMGLGPLSAGAGLGTAVPTNPLSMMAAGNMMTPQQQQALLLQQQQQQQLQQLQLLQQKNALLQTGFNPAMPPPSNATQSHMRSSFTGPMNPNGLTVSPSAKGGASQNDDNLSLSPSSFKW